MDRTNGEGSFAREEDSSELMIRSLIRTIRESSATIMSSSITKFSATQRPPSRRRRRYKIDSGAKTTSLMKTYEYLARTFDLVNRLICQFRRELLNAAATIFDHHYRCDGGDDDDREDVFAYDHFRNDEMGLIVRCTVISVDYVRDLTALMVRSIVRDYKEKMQKGKGTPPRTCDATTGEDVTGNALLSFFAYVHKKIVARAIKLVVQRTLERAVKRIGETTTMTATTIRSSSPPSQSCSTDNDDDERPTLLACYVCNRSFDKTFHYLQHIRVHYRLNLYLCVHCRESFVQQNGLNYHVNHCCSAAAAATTMANEPRRAEEKRKDWWSSRSSLSSREDHQHYELCDSCGHFFENGRCLRNHVLREHAVRNADLGVNRTQQEYVRKILNVL